MICIQLCLLKANLTCMPFFVSRPMYTPNNDGVSELRHTSSRGEWCELCQVAGSIPVTVSLSQDDLLLAAQSLHLQQPWQWYHFLLHLQQPQQQCHTCNGHNTATASATATTTSISIAYTLPQLQRESCLLTSQEHPTGACQTNSNEIGHRDSG